jgi:hypothetical protein
MPSLRATIAAGSAVKAFLAEIASVYLGRVYDHKNDAWSKMFWEHTLAHFDHRCAYCHTPMASLPKGVKMTMEHLIEENQWRCGLHHPGNTVPACSACNGSRDKAKDGSRLSWQQHLRNLGKAKGWNASAIEKRRKLIQDFVDQGGYPEITPEEMDYLKKTAQALYQDILKRCTAGRRRFVEIHRADAVRKASQSV